MHEQAALPQRILVEDVALLIRADMHPHHGHLPVLDSEKALHALRIYESYCRGESMKKATASWLIPDRAFFAAVYRLLRQAGGWQKDEWGLISALSLPGEAVGRLLIALDVLEERGLIRRDAASGVLSLCPTAEKQNLEASPVFAQIHKLCVLLCQVGEHS